MEYEIIEARCRGWCREESYENQKIVPCFHWVADCGGDEIWLCASCLGKLQKEVEKH